jgi:hypothetical protein
LDDYRLRFRGVTSAEYAIGHVTRHLGDKLLVDIDEAAVLSYQSSRLKELAAPKSVNEEVQISSDDDGAAGRRDSCQSSQEEKTQAPDPQKNW